MRRELEEAAQQPCTRAMPSERPRDVAELERIEVYGTTAQLLYEDETLFLTRLRSGWRVMAAVCTEQEPRPYDCRVTEG